jgi:hypothetical protein
MALLEEGVDLFVGLGQGAGVLLAGHHSVHCGAHESLDLRRVLGNGKRNVVPSLTCVVKGLTSMPLALKAAAFSEEDLMAGKTTALEATTSWQSAEARYSTHFTEGAGFLVPA